MPLLRRQPFAKQKPPANLRPDEEVFFCQLTNEVFRDYEEFFERIILCNSLVWSCALTGKTGLTYQEALECEEKAKQQLSKFPSCLERPIIYLISLTRRTNIKDVNEDIFNFVKDRYFVGENVEVYIKAVRKTCKILGVNRPVEEKKTDSSVIDLTQSDSDVNSDLEGASKKNKGKDGIKPERYTYRVQLTSGGKEIVTANGSQLNRKKGTFTRDKAKLFIKRHCEQDRGFWCVKPGFYKHFKIGDMNIDKFFVGPPPSFPVSAPKKIVVKRIQDNSDLLMSKKAKKKKMQEEAREKAERLPTMEEEQMMIKMTPEEREALRHKLKAEKEALKAQEKEILKLKFEEEKQKRKEDRDRERIQQQMERIKKIELQRQWLKPRDDLECDDLKILPEPKPVSCRIPNEAFGDALLLLEFVDTYKDYLEVEELFPDGLTIDNRKGCV